MGKMVLFTKRTLYGHHYIESTCVCVSPTHGQIALIHLRVHAFLKLSFKWSIVSPGEQWSSNEPKSKNQLG